MNADRGFKWKTLLVAPLAAAATRRAIGRRLRREAYDLVHAHWVVPGGILAHGPARAARRPFVISLHGSDVFAAERSALVGAAARRAFAAAGSVTACSRDLSERALRLGARPETLRTVPYGVDAGFFHPRSTDPATRETLRRRLGVSPAQTLIVAVGRLVEKKGFEHLIDALGGTPRLHAAIVGDGDLHDSLLARASSVRASVTLAGRFSRADTAAALSAADIVAVPSVVDSKGNVDGLPNALLEAMAAGGSIVASRVAGIPDVLTDGVEGVLVPPQDTAALRSALLRLAEDAPGRAALGANARRQVERNLTWERVAMTLEECYVQAQTLAKR